GLVYFSRDFIHEMSFGFFSLGVVVGAWRYAESKNFSWLAMTATSAGLLFATKETAIITAGVLIIAALCAQGWDIWRRLAAQRDTLLASFVREFRRDCADVAPSLDHALAAIMIFVFINIFFYSSFFTNWQGVPDAIKSVFLWTGRRNSEHQKDLLYYIGVLLKLELPLLLGSLLAGIFIVWRGTRFWLFVAAWTFGLTMAYSIIKYKTPWLMISFIIPMTLLSGHAAQRIFDAASLLSIRLLFATALVAVLILNVRLAWTVNFDKYDDNSNSSGYLTRTRRNLDLIPIDDGLYGYVYAQTDRDIYELVKVIKSETDKLPSGLDTPIYVAMPEYWPLPWYLREYKNVSFSGKLPDSDGGPSQISQSIIIANMNQQSILNALPGWRESPRAYKLRPGVELVVYVRDGAEQR
ncbi:MAG: hypothetical protein J2P21_00205, partial [Chloracidobacterium sp.]|nr:hypothetical protein [Chloracidobacterium sp.]